MLGVDGAEDHFPQIPVRGGRGIDNVPKVISTPATINIFG